MVYTWILFDADNTLFDYDRAEKAALQSSFEQFGFGFDPGCLATYRQINGQIWQAFERGEITPAVIKSRRFELLFEALGKQADPQAFGERYLENLGQGTTLIDGAEQVVRALHGKINLALITNGLQKVQRARLAKSAIGDCFDAVIISEEVGASKPDVAILEIAFAKMRAACKTDVSKADVLIVGDSLTSDIQGGNNYGIDTCWFNPSHEPRSTEVAIRYEIHRLDELLDIVGVNLSSRCPEQSFQ